MRPELWGRRGRRHFVFGPIVNYAGIDYAVRIRASVRKRGPVWEVRRADELLAEFWTLLRAMRWVEAEIPA